MGRVAFYATAVRQRLCAERWTEKLSLTRISGWRLHGSVGRASPFPRNTADLALAPKRCAFSRANLELPLHQFHSLRAFISARRPFFSLATRRRRTKCCLLSRPGNALQPWL